MFYLIVTAVSVTIFFLGFYYYYAYKHIDDRYFLCTLMAWICLGFFPLFDVTDFCSKSHSNCSLSRLYCCAFLTRSMGKIRKYRANLNTRIWSLFGDLSTQPQWFLKEVMLTKAHLGCENTALFMYQAKLKIRSSVGDPVTQSSKM